VRSSRLFLILILILLGMVIIVNAVDDFTITIQSSGDTPTVSFSQIVSVPKRQIWKHNGYFWLFSKMNTTDFGYSTSPDCVTWANYTSLIHGSAAEVNGYQIDSYYDGSLFHVAAVNLTGSTLYLHYLRCTPSGITLSIVTNYVGISAVLGSSDLEYITITVRPNGKPVICWSNSYGAGYPILCRASNTLGTTWESPQWLNTTGTSALIRIAPIPLQTAGDFYVIYSHYYSPYGLYGRACNDTNIGDEEVINTVGSQFSVLNETGTIHMVYTNGSDNYLYAQTRTAGSWSTNRHKMTTFQSSGPAICTIDQNGDRHYLWRYGTTGNYSILYEGYHKATAYWSEVTYLVTNISSNPLDGVNLPISINNNDFPFIYLKKSLRLTVSWPDPIVVKPFDTTISAIAGVFGLFSIVLIIAALKSTEGNHHILWIVLGIIILFIFTLVILSLYNV